MMTCFLPGSLGDGLRGANWKGEARCRAGAPAFAWATFCGRMVSGGAKAETPGPGAATGAGPAWDPLTGALPTLCKKALSVVGVNSIIKR